MKNDFCSMSIKVNGVMPTLIMGEFDGLIQLRLSTPNSEMNIDLDPIAAHAIGMQCIALFPKLVPEPKPIEFEDNCRKLGQVVADLDNRSIQFLLRSCIASSITDFLWYMKNERIKQRIFENCSKSCVSQMKEEFEDRWRNFDPDTAPPALIDRGRNAMQYILKELRRLIAEGSVPDIYGIGDG